MTHEYSVIIVGAGFSGISMGLELQVIGISNWLILEKESRIGGTWAANTYPGSGSDVPSILYQLKRAPYHRFTRKFADQHEILNYIETIAEPLKPKIKYEEEVLSIEFLDQMDKWLITTQKNQFLSRFVILSMSPLAKPSVPVLPGQNNFRGKQVHTAQWHDAINYHDKNVIVVGSGASAIQCIETIQPYVKQLFLIQRSPSWVMAKGNRDNSILSQYLLQFRGYFLLAYLFTFLLHEIKVLLFINPKLMELVEWFNKRRIKQLVTHPQNRRSIIPDYALGCKRIVLSDHYYQAINSPNVSIHNVTISKIEESGVTLEDGTSLLADIIIYATGFEHAQHVPINRILANGLDLKEVWKKKRSAYLGMFVSAFPNLFLLVGPNTGLGHQSLLFMIERQTNYLSKMMKYLLNHHVKRVNVKREKELALQRKIDSRNQGTVWEKGCQSWYLDAKGNNVALWPFSSLYYWWLTKDYNKNDFEIKF